jgi:hypothetical protein
MAYPMTYRRVLDRNHLQDGDYGQPPAGWRHLTAELNQGFAMLAGDLRRLEHDAVDGQALCHEIAERSGQTPEVVASVLREFFDS